MTLSNSASLGALKLVGSLAVGLGLVLTSVASGCSSDDSSTGAGGSAGSSSGAAGSSNETGGGTSEGGAGTAGGGTDGSTAKGGFCARPQMASDIGDHCIPDSGIMIKNEASECLTTSTGAGDGGDQYQPSHSGTSTDDDDCKYDVSYGIEHFMDACTADRGPATLHVNLKSRVTGMGITGAEPSVEVFLDDTHPLPSSPKQVVTDDGMGDYTIKNVPFDAEGAWTVRFHFFEKCAESPKTKHGHVAFTVLVSTP
jgi:hypothetical protein